MSYDYFVTQRVKNRTKRNTISTTFQFTLMACQNETFFGSSFTNATLNFDDFGFYALRFDSLTNKREKDISNLYQMEIEHLHFLICTILVIYYVVHGNSNAINSHGRIQNCEHPTFAHFEFIHTS